MELNEKIAYLHGGKLGGEYLESIGKSDLAQLTPDEWLTFLECVCKNYHVKFLDLEYQSQRAGNPYQFP